MTIIRWVCALALALMPVCATAQTYATCPNAHRALVLAETAVARVCPIEPR